MATDPTIELLKKMATQAAERVATPSSKLRSYADAFVRAPRAGADVDEPEGTRYVQLSHTLMLELAEDFRYLASQIEGSDK